MKSTQCVILSVLLTMTLLAGAPWRAAARSLEKIQAQVAEVAPGVYRVRAGKPETIVPSLARPEANLPGLKAMPTGAVPFPLADIHVTETTRGVCVEVPFQAGEVIYGLGLQCQNLIQNGWRKTLFTTAGDTRKGGGHAPVPFYVSTGGYGVLVDSARFMTFSVAEEQRISNASDVSESSLKRAAQTDVQQLYAAEKPTANASIYIDVPSAHGVDIYLFAGPRMGDAIARYNLFSGGGCLPAMSGLGPCYIFGTMMDANGVLAGCDVLQREKIPMTSASLEPGWQTHAYSSSYRWDTKKFPLDFPAQMRTKGYPLNLWCQMYIDPSSALIPQLKNRIGDFEVWHGVVPDVADPAVRAAYRDFLVENFIKRGVAGFKLDEVDGSWNGGAFEEWMFPEFASFPSGATGDQLRNELGRFGNQAIADGFKLQNLRTFSLTRALNAWSAALPMAVYSDEYKFEDFIRYNLSAGVQGILWTPEVRNAADERDWALRLAVAAFSARMTYNGWQFPHLIWQQPSISASEQNQLLPDENPYSKLARHFNNLRMALLPYLYQAYSDYHDKGIAPVRPLVADWPEDASVWHLDDEWMLGPDLLVAPVTDENAFSELDRVALAGANQFKADSGVRMEFQEGVLSLDIAGDGDGLPGASMEFDLKPGQCVARLLARGDIGHMAMRLRRVENDHETDVGELYKDDIQLDDKQWTELMYHFNVPADGHYRLSVAKGYFQRLSEAKRLELRDVSFEQRTGNPMQSWKRMVYLPVGTWRDFWTGEPVAGGQRLAVTATAEHPPIFVHDNTLLPLAEPVVTLNSNILFKVHLATYGDNPQSCQLREDDGTTFDYEQGKWAAVTVHPDGTIDRPDHGQPQRYRIVGQAESPVGALNAVLGQGDVSSANTIKPGDVWPDDRGQHIQAHGGGILKLGDTWYWFGEDRSRDNDAGKRYVACYSSQDLSHWHFCHQVVQLADPEHLGAGWVLERAKVFYNAATRKFVMYTHLDDGGYALARVAVFQCDTVDGDYQYLTSFRPLDHESRDIGQFIDDDGTAYLLSEDRPNGFHILKLSDDHLSIAKDICLIPEHLEGLALAHYGGLYYIVGSHLSSWAPNPNVYATAKSLAGPWTAFADIAPAETKTYGSQSSFLLKVSGTKATNVIFMADLWKPDSQWDSRYLWTPLQIGDGKLWLPKPCDWTINVHTGEAAVLKTARDVSEDELKQLAGVTLISANGSYKTSSKFDPELGSGLLLEAGDGQDALAFHTQSEPGANVEIDLKREREIVGATILNRADDRQDIEDRAASLAMWLSDDAVHWRCVWNAGTAKPVWSFELDQPQQARYVKVGLRDVNFLHLKRVRIYGR